jgi:aminopeptidase N
VEILQNFHLQDGAQENFTFTGKVIITLNATEPNIKTVVLHQYKLQISDYQFSSGETGSYNDEQYNNITDKWTISVANPIAQTGTTTLTIKFTGVMEDGMEGFYRSYYMQGGQKVWMAATQFQMTEARRAFPCFDVSNFPVPQCWPTSNFLFIAHSHRSPDSSQSTSLR